MVQNVINNLANYFINNKFVKETEVDKIINTFLKELKIKDFTFKRNTSLKEINKSFYEDINSLREYIVHKEQLSPIETENRINYLLGLFTPEQSVIESELKKAKDPLAYLRKLSLLNYYVKSDKNSKNLNWIQKTKYGNLKITINKAKPEKTIEQIKAEKENKTFDKNKPKCPICIENIGYHATPTTDSRENLRVFKMRINNDNWFMQYSPYEYVTNHFVLNNLVHQPMAITSNTVIDLVEFVSKYPHMFLGSNADLPIVGGSLLSHNHYQGGDEVLPVMRAKVLKQYKVDSAIVSILQWPLNCVRVTSPNKEEIINIGNYLIREWKHYHGKEIINDNNNTSTLILDYKKNKYNLYILFRNNSCSEDRPTGLYHVHPKRFNIKQENIGLMEAAGLAILPKRLEAEMQEILNWSKDTSEPFPKYLEKHEKWVKDILNKKGKITKEILYLNIGDTFTKGLEDCKVLKNSQFEKFISNCLEDEIVLRNRDIKLTILKQGFTIKQIQYKNKTYLLEYKDKNAYYANSIFLNSFVGPIAGRIQEGIVKTDKKEWKLPIDENKNYIHSMDFNTVFYNFEFSKVKKNSKVQSFDASLNVYNEDVKANYTFKIKTLLTKEAVEFKYIVEADKDFICNPTQHFYFKFQKDNVLDYNININNKFSVWLLNTSCNPKTLSNIKNSKEFISVKDLAKEFSQSESKIINGYIDHPFVNHEAKDIILKSKSSAIELSSTIKDFVIYTHNWPNDYLLKNGIEKQPNQGICVEFQNTPCSNKTNNYEKIVFNKKDKYSNSIKIKFIK